MIALCKKFPVKYEDKKYYAKLFKYDWHANIEIANTIIANFNILNILSLISFSILIFFKYEF